MVFIKAISYYLPKRVVSNAELVEEFPEWTVEKIASKVGVDERRVAAADETAVDMAVQAAENIFEEFKNVRREDVYFVLFCTQSPDFFLPTSSCLIQSRLGLRDDIGALDFNLGCSGYVYGLAVAKGIVASGLANNVLLIKSETYSKYIHPKDKGNRTIFGDAATATIISNEGYAEIKDFVLGTDGTGAENLIVKSGAMRSPNRSGEVVFDENGNPYSADYLYMNGAEIFTFTQSRVPNTMKEVLQKNGLTQEEIDLFVFHQANKYMLNFLRKKIKLPESKFFVNMEKVGNTVSNSIPIALCDAKQQGLLQGNVLLLGFGVGYSWGGVVIQCINKS